MLLTPYLTVLSTAKVLIEEGKPSSLSWKMLQRLRKYFMEYIVVATRDLLCEESLGQGQDGQRTLFQPPTNAFAQQTFQEVAAMLSVYSSEGYRVMCLLRSRLF